MEGFWIMYLGFWTFACVAGLLFMIAPVVLILYMVKKLDMRKGGPFNIEFRSELPVEETRQQLMNNLRGASIFSIENPVFLPQGDDKLTINRKFIPEWAIVIACLLVFFWMWLGIALLLVNENEILTAHFTPEADGRQTKVSVSGFASTVQREKLMQMAGIPVQSN